MTDLQDIYIVSGVRTPVGSFGGSLKSFMPSELGSMVITEAVKRGGIAAGDVEHVVLGQVISTGPKDAYLARVCALNADIPNETPALTLNRLCGSGLQAIISSAQMMKLGEAKITVAGGAECMTQAPYFMEGLRWGKKMGDARVVDGLTRGLEDPIGEYHMGVTAENVADLHGISRQEQDELAAESHRRASRAIEEGRFKEQILPIEIKSRKGTQIFDTDEHVRHDVDSEAMSKMKPAFKRDCGTVTAGNASGINDGAAAVTLATEEAVKERGLKPMARIVSWAHAGVPPEIMGVGPVKAVPIALERAGLSIDDIDVIESNEAFAAQACAVAKELKFPPEKVNPNGSGVSLGHPVGATGAILTVKCMYELKRIKGRYGLITMCIGGGQGIAMVIENVDQG